jgi:hypothetical protein
VVLTNQCKFADGEWLNPAVQVISAQLKPFNLVGHYNFMS